MSAPLIGLPRYGDIPICESPYAPSGGFLYIDGNQYGVPKMVLVRDMWTNLELPLMIFKMQEEMSKHLADLVRAAELRLGLS